MYKPINLFKKTCHSILIATGLLLTQAGNSATFNLDTRTSADTRIQLQQLGENILNSSALINRERFDFDTVIKNTGKSPENIFRWVNNNTNPLPYKGVLKGAWGVLMERQGNTLDRSLLLAELLERAGHRVELANATLNNKGLVIAKKLVLKELKHPLSVKAESNPPLASKNQREELERVAKISGISVESVLKEINDKEIIARKEINQLVNEANKQTMALMKKLPLDNHAATPVFTEALHSLEDHWWVLVKTDSEVKAFDFFFDQQQKSLKVLNYIKNKGRKFSKKNLPGDLYHTVTFRVIAEQRTKIGGNISNVALTHTIRTAQAQLQPIQLEYIPLNNRIGSEDVSNLLTKGLHNTLAKQSEWLPILKINGEIKTQGSILSSGSVNKTPDTSRSDGGTAQALNNTAKSLGGMFGSLGSSIGGVTIEPTSTKKDQLTGVRLEIEFKNEKNIKQETRVLFDFSDHIDNIDNNKEMKINLSSKFMASQQLLIMPFNISGEYVTKELHQAIRHHQELLMQLVENKISFTEQDILKALSKYEPLLQELLNFGLLRQESQNMPFAIVQANLISFKRKVSINQSKVIISKGIDIIANNVLPLLSDAEQGRKVSIKQGIFDTLLENYLIEGNKQGTNTASLFSSDLVRNNAISWKAVDLNNRSENISHLHNNINNSSTKPFIVYSPTNIPGDITLVNHWLVDLNKGTTLGYLSSGEGGSFVEKIIIDANTIWTYYNLAKLFSCAGNTIPGGNYCSRLKCLLSASLAGMGFNLGKIGVALGGSKIIMARIGILFKTDALLLNKVVEGEGSTKNCGSSSALYKSSTLPLVSFRHVNDCKKLSTI